MKRMIERLGSLGDREGDSEAARLEHRFLIYMAVMMSLGGLAWGSFCLAFAQYLQALIPYGYALMTAINLGYFRASRDFGRVRALQMLMSLLLPFLFQCVIGGFAASGAAMLWAMLALVGSLTFTAARASIKWLVTYVLLTVVSGLVDSTMRREFDLGVSPDWRVAFFVINIAVISSVVFGLTLYMMAQREIARRVQGELAEKNTQLEEEVSKARLMGSYRLKRRLGHGGMGEVWMAEHTFLARPAAVKLIRTNPKAGRETDELMTARFEREAQATAALRSSHTIRLYDFGRSRDGTFYYVMELLDGLTLEELVERFGAQPPERAAHLLAQVCDSLAEAHGVGLVHRDIKPANIFISRQGRRGDFVTVLDFGMVKSFGPVASSDVKLTGEGAMAGTITYAPPESHMEPDKLDARADIYSLGCVAYWLLTGRLTFDGDTPLQIALKHVGSTVVPPSQVLGTPIPARLEALVLACLEKDPQRRPDSAEDLGAELAAIARAGGWDNRRAVAWWDAQMPSSGGATYEKHDAAPAVFIPQQA